MTAAAIVSIGTELTRGELVNGNACWLAEQLTELGFAVVEHATVADDAKRIVQTLTRLASETALIVCTGGLGPTSDDLTSAAVADALGVPLVRDAASLDAIEARYRVLKRAMPALNVKQADFPQGATILPNAVGTAPGFAVTLTRREASGSCRAFFLPGVPSEMQHLFVAQLVPALGQLVTRTSHQAHIRTVGLGESPLAERLKDLDLGGSRHSPGVTIGYRASFPEVEVKVLAECDSFEESRALAEQVADEVRALLSDVAYGGKGDNYPAYVGNLLRRAGLRVALAESCTGGLIGKLLTDPAGSSDYLIGGAVVYANTAKHRVLGVDKQVLRDHGAVSEEVARAMAEGALQLLGAKIAVAVTGVAGPGGGTEQKPVGTVCFALAFAGTSGAPTRTCTELFPGDRERVRVRTAYFALRMLAQAAQETLEALDARDNANVQQERVS